MKLMKAIIGDICGSLYEFNREKVDSYPTEIMLEECHFTDDTVCTVALADAILHNPENPDFDTFLKRWVLRYPRAGYGKKFIEWVMEDKGGDSFGNGCCMRLYPISVYYNDYYCRKAMIAKSCSGSHNHVESYLFSNILDDHIHGIITGLCLYSPLEEYRETYKFDCTCHGSVIEAITIGMKASSYENCIKDAIYLGGDVDTIACMAGMVTVYEPSEELEKWVWNKLPKDMQNIIAKFEDEIIKLN